MKRTHPVRIKIGPPISCFPSTPARVAPGWTAPVGGFPYGLDPSPMAGQSLMTLIYSLLALVGGALFPMQTAVNAQLGRSVGGALVATIVSFCVGLVALLAILLATTRQLPDIGIFKAVPAYLYVGGLLGATFLGLSVFLTPKIGSGTLMCLAIAGQILTAMLIDYFGWFGLPVRELSALRVAGAALVAAGVALVRFY